MTSDRAADNRDDEALVRDFLSGDADAFEEIMRRHQRMVYFAALRVVGRHEDADDVTQKVFLSVYRNLRGFQGRSRLKTWIFRITLNLAKNCVRDRGRHEGDEIGESMGTREAEAPSRMEEAEQRALMARAVRTLPARQRQVFELRVRHDLPFAEVARVAGISVGTAKVNFHHAVRALRQKLAPDPASDE